MKYEEYIKKHHKVLEPVSEVVPLINTLSIIQMLGNEIGGDFADRADEFCKKEKEIILKSELRL